MLPEWLNNSAVVNLVLIIFAVVGLIFQINSSEHTLRFAKKFAVIFGRVMAGALVMIVRLLILSWLQQADSKIGLNWHELVDGFSFQNLLVAVVAGSLISFIASNAATLRYSIIKSIIVSAFALVLIDVVLQDLTQNISFQNILNLIVSSIMVGGIISMLLQIFKLRSNRFIVIMKSPFFN